MRMWLGLGAAALLIGGVVLARKSEPSDVYAKTVPQALAELAATPIPRELDNAFSGTPTVVRMASSIIWHLGREGEGAIVTATLTAADATHTKVTLDSRLERPDTVSSLSLSTPYVGGLVRASMGEQIAAELEDRAFDRGRYDKRLAAYIADHPEEAQQFGDALKANFHEADRRMKEGMAAEAADAARAAAAPPPVPPSTSQMAQDAPSLGDPAAPTPGAAPTTDLSAYQ